MKKTEPSWYIFGLHLSPVTCDLLKRFPQLETGTDHELSLIWTKTYLMMLVVTRLSVFMLKLSSPPDSIVTNGLLWFPSFLNVSGQIAEMGQWNNILCTF